MDTPKEKEIKEIEEREFARMHESLKEMRFDDEKIEKHKQRVRDMAEFYNMPLWDMLLRLRGA